MERPIRRAEAEGSIKPRFAAIFVTLAAALGACSGGAEPAKDPASGATPSPSPQAAPKTETTSAQSTPPAGSSTGSASAPTPTTSAEPPPKPPAVAACSEGMALVPGGSFKMELRKDPVTVAPLCMDTTEVTADQYAACVKAGKCSADNLKCAGEATYEAPEKGNHPIVCVDFKQAVTYCEAQGKRLPSDEEWEWAARGGAEGRPFPWGTATPKEQLCWSGVRTRNGTCAVGSIPAGDNPQGIHDLAGNVFEWTTSKNDARTKVRVGRGGSWKDGVPELVRAARPGGFEVTYRCGFLGIRCVTPAPGGAGEAASSPPAGAK